MIGRKACSAQLTDHVANAAAPQPLLSDISCTAQRDLRTCSSVEGSTMAVRIPRFGHTHCRR